MMNLFAANLLDRQFSVFALNKVWVSDITYLKIGSKWYYLTVFIGFCSIIVVSWDLSSSLARYSTIKAFKKGIMRRNPSEGLMIHSDRGVQYASSAFRSILRRNGFVQSMSRKGNCWDNAVTESFFHTLKTQLIHHVKFKNRKDAERKLFVYIEAYYNRRRRRHSTNGYLSPAEFEKRYTKLRLAA